MSWVNSFEYQEFLRSSWQIDVLSTWQTLDEKDVIRWAGLSRLEVQHFRETKSLALNQL